MVAEVVVVGGGIAGVVSALQLLDGGAKVTLLDRAPAEKFGGLAVWAFGGMALFDTPQQRRLGIKDSAELGLRDWLRNAEFGPDDHWPRQWAEHYVSRCVPEILEWLKLYGVGFMSAVQWVERGWHGEGNSVPRYHMVWGTSHHLIKSLIARLQAHPQRANLTLRFRHLVTGLIEREGTVSGCHGIDEASGQEFELTADAVVIASGGVTGNLDRVRQVWPRHWGQPPEVLMNGSHPEADGRLHDAAASLGGRITHLDQMWNYAAGVHPPKPHFAGHGLSLVPTKSALWLDHLGQRIGPLPFMTGFDTYGMVETIARRGFPYTWMLMNRRIAEKELAISGSEHNQLARDRKMLPFILQILRGNKELIDHMLRDCIDFVSAPDLAQLAERMNALAGNRLVNAEMLRQQVEPFDAQIARGPKFHNDDQLRRIAQLRNWGADKVRTCNFQRIQDPEAGPLIAIRCFVLVRKSMGGIQTDLASRVLNQAGTAIPGLYAAGEATGFGGGGIAGKRSLEGTFLSGCILTAKAAARSILGKAA